MRLVYVNFVFTTVFVLITLQQELERAKQTISVLETELSSERSRLRTMMTEQDRMQREKKQILTDLQRTESVRRPRYFHSFLL